MATCFFLFVLFPNRVVPFCLPHTNQDATVEEMEAKIREVLGERVAQASAQNFPDAQFGQHFLDRPECKKLRSGSSNSSSRQNRYIPYTETVRRRVTVGSAGEVPVTNGEELRIPSDVSVLGYSLSCLSDSHPSSPPNHKLAQSHRRKIIRPTHHPDAGPALLRPGGPQSRGGAGPAFFL